MGVCIVLLLNFCCEVIGLLLEDVIWKCRDRFVSFYFLYGKMNNKVKFVNLILVFKEFVVVCDVVGIVLFVGKILIMFYE